MGRRAASAIRPAARDIAPFLLWAEPERLNFITWKPRTSNDTRAVESIPEHSGAFENIPEHSRAVENIRGQAWGRALRNLDRLFLRSPGCSHADTAPPFSKMTPWPSAASSSGEVRRRNDGSIASVQGMMNYQLTVAGSPPPPPPAVTSVELHNARGEALSLDGNGVELRSAPVAETVDYYSQQSIVGTYFPHCEQLIKEASGAAFVKAFDYNVRSAKGEQAGRKLEGGSQ
ncbi:hypothetical protein T484DRAFT_1744745, partial [Baffinella frigidus]